jgi:ATP-dependent Lon protease
MKVVSEGVKRIDITGDTVEQYLGVRKYHPEKRAAAEQVGVVNGIAWTSVGGELLEVEANVVPARARSSLPGILGRS